MGKNWRQSRRARKRAAMQRALEADKQPGASASGELPPPASVEKKKPRPRQTRRRRGEASDEW